jgi:nitrogen fixation/metabolism regulation signal transduction histidine kinase
MRVIAASDLRRLALGLIVLAVLLAVVAGLYIYGRRQFSMELEHLRLRGFSRAVLDGMGEAVIVLDDEDRVVQLNPACRNFCADCDETDCSGRRLRELSPALADTLATLRREDVAAREIELPGPGRQSTNPVLVATSSQEIAGRRYTIIILTDISDRREKERLALRGQRLRTMAEVSAGMAHEIRNPLNAIAMNVQRLKLEFAPSGDDREEYERFVETIRGEVNRLNRIVEQFLTFARFPHPVPEQVDLTALVTDTLSFSAADLEARSISTTVDLEPSGKLMLDSGQMRQVLTNLVANAAQAIGSDGSIEIRGRTSGREYVLRVADSGPGIDGKDLEKIFEPFYTTRLKGTGLGLAIAARIVGEHGGTIHASNAENGGAEFSVSLPLGAYRGTMGKGKNH